MLADITDQVSAASSKVAWKETAEQSLKAIECTANTLLEPLFRVKKKKPRPTWLPNEVWQQLGLQKQSRRRLRNVTKHLRSGLLRAVFLGWQDGRCESQSRTAWVRRCQSEIAKLEHAQRLRTVFVKRLLADARKRELDRQAAEHCGAIESADSHAAWKAVRKVVPALKKTAGAAAYACVADEAQDHFASIEDGEAIPVHVLRKEVAEVGDWAQLMVAEQAVELDNMPTLFELEDAVRKLKAGKAYDLCRLPPELARSSCSAFARAIWPLFLKFWVWKAEPWVMKGGRVSPLYKGQGSRQVIANYRSICITSTLTRIFQSVLRERLRLQIQPKLWSLHIGGMPFMGVDFGSHALRTAMSAAIWRKSSFAVIFLDLASAFYSVRHASFSVAIL